MFSGSAVIDDNGDLRFYYTGHRWANGHDDAGGDWQVQMPRCRTMTSSPPPPSRA